MATMAKKCYYETLKIEKSASKREIEVAYRRLAARYHPDSNKSEDAHERFKECTEAFEVLTDPQKRQVYDRYGHEGLQGGMGGGGGFGGSPFGDGMPIDLHDFVGAVFGGRSTHGPMRGDHIQRQISLTLEEAYAGVQRDITFSRIEQCEDCEGTGAAPGAVLESCVDCQGQGKVMRSLMGIVRTYATCPTCRGEGRLVSKPCQGCRGEGYKKAQRSLTITIPPGVTEETVVETRGEGQPSFNGGPPGDLQIYIRLKQHPLFQRDRNRLILRLPISYTQAALGATVEVPTLGGPASLDIPGGTQNGHVFRMAGKGMRIHGGGIGELAVQVFIEVPKKLDAEQEKLLRELAEIENKQVAPQRKSFLEQVKDYFTGSDASTS